MTKKFPLSAFNQNKLECLCCSKYVAMPYVAMPNVAMPYVAMPNVPMPNVPMPNVSMPNGSMPNVAMPNVIKHFMAVIYGCSKYARAFVPGRSLQPSQMFVSRVKAGRLWP